MTTKKEIDQLLLAVMRTFPEKTEDEVFELFRELYEKCFRSIAREAFHKRAKRLSRAEKVLYKQVPRAKREARADRWTSRGKLLNC